MFTFKDIIETLHKNNVDTVDFRSDTNQKYIRATLWKEDIKNPEPSVIYIANTEQFSKNKELICKNAYFLLSEPQPHSCGFNYALFSSLIKPDNLLEETNIAFSQLINDFLIKNELNNVLLQDLGLKRIMILADKFFENPIFFQDPSSKVVEMSDFMQLQLINDEVLKKTVSKGFAPSDSFSKHGFGEVLKTIASSDEAVLISTGYAKTHRRLMMRVQNQNTFIGHITVVEKNRPFSQQDFLTLKHLSKVLGSELQKKKYLTPSSDVRINIITDILSGKIASATIFNSIATNINWHPGENLCVIALHRDSKKDLEDNTDFLPLSTYLRQIFPQSIVVCRKSHILMLLDIESSYGLTIFDQKLVKFISENHMQAGISKRFSDILSINHYYEQAKRFIKIGNRIDNRVNYFQFKNLISYDLLFSVEKYSNLNEYCLEEIKDLANQDILNKTDYLKTIYEYLLHGRSISATAEKLFVHKNTVTYRVDRFCQITGLDITNIEDCFLIILSIKILEFSKSDFFKN